MELYADIHLACASICGRVGGHIHWEIFFGRRGISFRFGQFVSLSTEAIFSFNFWETASIVSLGEAKMASFLGPNFVSEFGAKVCLFWSLWQIIPDWFAWKREDASRESCCCSAVVLQA